MSESFGGTPGSSIENTRHGHVYVSAIQGLRFPEGSKGGMKEGGV